MFSRSLLSNIVQVIDSIVKLQIYFHFIECLSVLIYFET
jgi:hypothetical protein